MTTHDQVPAPPPTSFASDNASGVHPHVLDAISAANVGGASAYGDDVWTRRTEDLFNELFGGEVSAALCWGGTGANVVALSSLLRPWHAVICAESAHINVDECGAPERFCGAKLLAAPTDDGKLTAAHIAELATGVGNQHHVQPKLVSVTQSSEMGTLYSVDELAAVCDEAKRHGLLVHVDGARIANAVAALDVDVAALSREIGVDVMSFGGTKNGMMYGEAVIWLDPATPDVAFARKQAAQLPSKMRFIAAQFEAMLTENLWLESASAANAAATYLAEQIETIPELELQRQPEVNSVFVRLDRALLEAVRDWSFFWEWQPAFNEVRWMTSFDTTNDHVDAFLRGVRYFAGRLA